jgi:hypothetical protein
MNDKKQRPGRTALELIRDLRTFDDSLLIFSRRECCGIMSMLSMQRVVNERKKNDG